MSWHTPSELPWSGSLSVDLTRGALSVFADGLAVIDAQHVCWAIVFPDVYGGYDHASDLVDAVNSHAANEAKIEALTAALRFYADVEHYKPSYQGYDPLIGIIQKPSPIVEDRGANARAALTSAGEK